MESKQSKVLARITKVNRLLDFSSDVWEKAFQLDLNDTSCEFERELRVIMLACDRLESKLMKESEQLRKQFNNL